MDAGGHEGGGLAHGVVGRARVIAFGASNVAPAGAVVGGLVIVVSYAGFASPLVVLVAFAASLWGSRRALGWLCLGIIAAGVLRARRPASFETVGRVFTPAK